MDSVDLTQHFLIAMPAMVDPHFAKSLTLVCEHNENGALGIVINRPTDMNLHGLLEQVKITPQVDRFRSVPVHFGGPVQVDRGFILHSPVGNWQSTLAVSAELGLTTSKDILEAVARDAGPERMLVTLGYAGWAPGQLEHELAQNAWLTVPARMDILFDMPAEERLAAAMDSLGVDYANLSDVAGHA
ncbi:MAG: YqgE/AlgH family protein [Betaproteobacteria bacterium]|jgi:putative transcriptional regulator|nr:YqgE/AlgH family protein [Betaproteobacteria bacterium]MDH4292611.1 YqgE/AlgH family protein [Betaproteobacteria bacterium]MDH5343049.1 YqgE/AlgH family protein [Betaproteobacteria bacterium]